MQIILTKVTPLNVIFLPTFFIVLKVYEGKNQMRTMHIDTLDSKHGKHYVPKQNSGFQSIDDFLNNVIFHLHHLKAFSKSN